jgi:hypothetical protein
LEITYGYINFDNTRLCQFFGFRNYPEAACAARKYQFYREVLYNGNVFWIELNKRSGLMSACGRQAWPDYRV